MSFAYWFDPTGVDGSYSDWARALVFESGILQGSGLPTHLRVGDLLYYDIPEDTFPHDSIAAKLEASNARPGLMREPIERALWKHRIYVVYSEDLSDVTALMLHGFLLEEPRYMGCYGVNPEVGLHRGSFCRLSLQYRISGDECWSRHIDEILELEELACFQRVLHVPVLSQEEGFADLVEWQQYCPDTPAEERWRG